MEDEPSHQRGRDTFQGKEQGCCARISASESNEQQNGPDDSTCNDCTRKPGQISAVERCFARTARAENFLRQLSQNGNADARASIGRYLDFYNGRRPHSSLDGMTPDQAYFTPLPLRLAA